MPTQNPGFDFITLTKAQWAHLKLIEREHGIPWYIYIRDLIKADMEGRLLHPGVRERRVKLKPSYEPKKLELLIEKMEKLLTQPRQMISWIPPPPPPKSGNFSGIIEGEAARLVRPSQVDEDIRYDPNLLSDGSSTTEHRKDLIDELREKIGLPPLERKKSAAIQFPSHIQIIEK